VGFKSNNVTKNLLLQEHCGIHKLGFRVILMYSFPNKRQQIALIYFWKIKLLTMLMTALFRVLVSSPLWGECYTHVLTHPGPDKNSLASNRDLYFVVKLP